MENEEIISADKDHANAVLQEIDGMIKNSEEFVNKSVARLSKLLIEAKRGAYWIERGFSNEDDYIKTLPYSRAQYYNLLGIGQHLGFLPENTIAEIGIKKAAALVRISKHSSTLTPEWLEKAKSSTHKDFLKEVRTFFKGKDEEVEEDIEWVRVKASKEQANIIREALNIASLSLGSEKSQAHQMEVICADFMSAHSDDGTGRLDNRDGFIISIISRLARQLDAKAINALVGALATVVEENDNER